MNEGLLINRALNGDDEAFEQIVLKYRRMIYAVCFKITGNEQDSFDAFQEALIKIYFNLREFNSKSKFSTWIYSISKNAAIDLLKEKERNLCCIECLLDEQEESKPYRLPNTYLYYRELGEELVNLINTLPDEMRAVIILRDIEGYSYLEISNILNISRGTMKSRLNRARKKLREGILPYLSI